MATSFESSDPTYPLFSILSFLGFLLPLIPLSWHAQAWNSGTVFYVFWSSLGCLNLFINSVVWKGNAINFSPGWCDISIRIMMGVSVGLPAASLCINRRLYKIARVQAVMVTRADKLRTVMIDTLICLVFPLVYIALQYIVQGHRFNLFEDVGCFPAVVNTVPTFFISEIWPIVLGLISATYCCLSLWQFTLHRLQFSQILSASQHNSLTPSRYFRLMALASTELCLTIPLASTILWINANAVPILPWTGFEDIHFDYGRVEAILATTWRSQKLVAANMEMTRWSTVLGALVFFAYFGFGEEAMSRYKMAYCWVAQRTGLPLPKPRAGSSKGYAGAKLASIGQFRSSPPPKVPVELISSPTSASSSPPSYYAQSNRSLMDVKIPSGHFSYMAPPEAFGVPPLPPSPSTSAYSNASTNNSSRFHEDVDNSTQSILTYCTHSRPYSSEPSSPTASPPSPSTATTPKKPQFTIPRIPPPPLVYGTETFSPVSPFQPPRRGWTSPSLGEGEDFDRVSGNRPITYPYPEYTPKGVRDADPGHFA